MENNGRIPRNQLTLQPGDSRYHLRLLGVLAVLVDRDVWSDAVRIADLLSRTAPEVTQCSQQA
jgi:hypothetical protein